MKYHVKVKAESIAYDDIQLIAETQLLSAIAGEECPFDSVATLIEFDIEVSEAIKSGDYKAIKDMIEIFFEDNFNQDGNKIYEIIEFVAI